MNVKIKNVFHLIVKIVYIWEDLNVCYLLNKLLQHGAVHFMISELAAAGAKICFINKLSHIQYS